jgi:hypothetical protein
MAMAPYPGQGFPIDKKAGYSGDWICAGKYFLCARTLVRVPTPLRNPNGNAAVGFSVDALAEKFGLAPKEVIDANRRGELSVEEAQQQSGANSKLLFDFYCKDRSLTLAADDIQMPVSSGHVAMRSVVLPDA